MGRDFGKIFLFSFLSLQMKPQDLFLYEKKMVIWFGDRLQGVKWLGNPREPINSVEFLAIFGGKCGITSM